MPAHEDGEHALPCNIDAERSLLGAVMLNNDAYIRASTIIDAEAFMEPIHAHIWKVSGQMIEAGNTANPITLKTYLGDTDLGGVTPMQYLAGLAGEVAAASNAMEYAKVIRDSFILRRIISIAESAKSLARNFPADLKIPDAISDLERDLDALIPTAGGESSDFRAFGDIDTSAIHSAYKDGESRSGRSTGLPRLDDAMGGLQDTDLIILAGRPAMGKAQPLDAAIKTIDGWTTMGEIRLGQALASPDGRFSVVTGIFPQGVMPIFEVTFSDGRKTKACGEHLWRVRSRYWEAPRVLSTDDLRALLQRKRHQGRLSIDLVTGDFGRSGHLPMDPWLLGLILGNGRVSGGIKLTTRDEENLARAERFLPTGMCIVRNENGTHSLRQKGNWRRPGHVGVSPNPIASYLRGAELSGDGCHTMFVPTEFMSACRPDRMALLQGLMDSNGYVEKKGAVRFVTTSPQLARDVESLVRSLGGLCRVVSKQPSYSHNGESLKGRTAYICCIRHADATVLFANSRKRHAATRGRNSSVRLSITNIEPAGSAEVQCIRVSHPESLYITDNYIVTHNTSLATGIGVHVARAERRAAREEKRRVKPVAFFSLEMAGEQVKGRVLAEQANVSAFRLRRGDVAPGQMEAFVEAEREMRDLPFYIDESGELSIAQLRMKARRFVKKRGPMALMIVDYIQLVKGSQRKGENRVQELTEITTGLKALAKELRVPILALSQLSRKVEERDDKRPILADLRESGSIEQDADIVLFVYREEYYLKDRRPRDEGEKLQAWERLMDRWKGIAEILVSKYRGGSTGSCELGFVPHLTQFLPEPEFRQVDPEESRKNAKRVVLSDHAKELKRIMYELAVQGGRRPTAEDLAQPKAPHARATMIDREELRRHFYDHVVSDLEDRQRRGALQRAADQLRSAKLTATFKDGQGRLWSYLIEMIED